jgi:23S rRNA pseudouridine1911/1915/1917 synthase
LTISPDHSGKRLDQFLPDAVATLGVIKSRSQIQELIKAGHILLNQRRVKPRAEIAAGDSVQLLIPREKPKQLLPERMDLEVLFEDEHLILINKAPGIVVHPGSGNDSGTLVNGLLHHCSGKLSQLADEGRPGIVHRLDKETSGCLVAAKSDLAYESLVAQFSGRTTKKSYIAIASGEPIESSGLIENHIGRHPVNRQKMAIVERPNGKVAITEYEVSHSNQKEDWSWINCRIFTGRTHQIRVHLKDTLRCPILGDTIYAKPNRQKFQVSRLMLHARELTLHHPDSGAEMTFQAPLPSEFKHFQNQD